MDIAGILSNEITHLIFVLIAGVLLIVVIIALLLMLNRWFGR